MYCGVLQLIPRGILPLGHLRRGLASGTCRAVFLGWYIGWIVSFPFSRFSFLFESLYEDDGSGDRRVFGFGDVEGCRFDPD